MERLARSETLQALHHDVLLFGNRAFARTTGDSKANTD